MNEIVEYHNDLHKLSMGSFTELEQNLLFGVLVKCREQKSGVEIELKADDLMRFINQRKNTTKQDLLNIALNLYDNFFKLDFKIIFIAILTTLIAQISALNEYRKIDKEKDRKKEKTTK